MTFRIYTKQGDQGKTRFANGQPASKASLRLETYGLLDELNSLIGICVAQGESAYLKSGKYIHSLERIQTELFLLGSELALAKNAPRMDSSSIEHLEHEIDAMTEKLPALTNFILPGGSAVSAALHLARTVCRKAERLVVALHEQEPLRPEVLIYLNRLSDFLFTLARAVNHELRIPDKIWQSRGPQV